MASEASAEKEEGGYWAVRPETVGELEPSEVRWFCQDASEKVPVPLCGADSVRVEVAWRLWKGRAMPERCRSVVGASVEEEKAGSEGLLPVLGGLYHAHLPSLSLSPIYWEEPSKILLRATWFRGPDSTTPFTGKDANGKSWAELLEEKHLETFKGQRIPSGTSAFLDSKAKKMTLASLKLSAKEEVLWSSPIDVQYRWNDLRSKFTRRLLNSGSGVEELRRGFPQLAHLEDAPKPIGHVVFVVHGIGQMASSQDVLELTKRIQKYVDKAQTKGLFGEAETRTLLFPVQWRKGLGLDKGLVDSITLRTHTYYRRLINHSLMDIMYYLSPAFNREIKTSVLSALSDLYKRFAKLHPDFEARGGDVSVLAHSLGGVISYDLLHDEAAQLPFTVKRLFCVGSPLGVFLSMRGGAFERVLNGVTRVFNVFYEQDFVGFRLEPLLHPAFQWLDPVPIAPYDKELRLFDYQDASPKLVKKHDKDRSASTLMMENPSRNSSALTLIQETALEASAAAHGALEPGASEEVAVEADEVALAREDPVTRSANSSPAPGTPTEETGSGSTPTRSLETVLEELRSSGWAEAERVDFALRPEQSWLAINLYTAVFNAHFNYWSSKDLAAFLLSHCYPKLVQKAKEEHESTQKPKKK